MNLEIKLTSKQFHAVASLAPFASRDDLTPIIQSVAISQHVSTVTAYSTDRYRAAEMVFDNEQFIVVNDAPLIVSAKTLTQFSKLIGTKTNTVVAIRFNDESKQITIEADSGQTLTDDLNARHGGEYPKLSRLFPEANTGQNDTPPILLNVKLLDALAKITTPNETTLTPAKRDATFKMSYTTTDSGRKNSPVLFEREDVSARIRVIVQPELWRA